MLEQAIPYISGFDQALDCGAGIGRISKETLLPRFLDVDLLEASPVQIEGAKKNVPTVRNFFCEGMQHHNFRARYDCIWLQWCVGYLLDTDFIDFLKKAKRDGLLRTKDGKTGLVFIKDNCCKDSTWLLDRDDNSVARTDKQFDEIFKASGFTVMSKFDQMDMPDELMPITCFILKPNYDN